MDQGGGRGQSTAQVRRNGPNRSPPRQESRQQEEPLVWQHAGAPSVGKTRRPVEIRRIGQLPQHEVRHVGAGDLELNGPVIRGKPVPV